MSEVAAGKAGLWRRFGDVFFLTTPNRYGVSVALVYWVRWRFGAENG